MHVQGGAPLVALALLATPFLGGAEAQDADAPAGSTLLSIYPRGFSHAGGAGVVRATLVSGGDVLDEANQGYGRDAGGSLEGIVVSSSLALRAGKAPFDYALHWDDAKVLSFTGVVEAVDGRTWLRIVESYYDPVDALKANASREAILVEEGWYTDTLTVVFAWRSSDPSPSDVSVDVSLADEARHARVEPLGGPTRAPDGAWAAAFRVSYLPLTLAWNATILERGVPVGVTGASVSFLGKTARDGFFENHQPDRLATAGGLHDVKNPRSVNRLPWDVFGARIVPSAECGDEGVYDTIYGETKRIASLLTLGAPCAKPPTTDNRSGQNLTNNTIGVTSTEPGPEVVTPPAQTPGWPVAFLVLAAGVATLALARRRQ